MLGHPAYMSPEQARGATQIDGRSDIYSLGCVLYEMLAGLPPFTGPPAAVLARAMAEPLPPLRTVCPSVPPAVEQTVVKALAKRPEDRSPARPTSPARWGVTSKVSRRAGDYRLCRTNSTPPAGRVT